METYDIRQGSPEWLAFRAAHFTASDAPAMLGESPYKTHGALLREKATGVTPDIDAATQRLFDDGHRFEALARPLAENLVGEELYACVGSAGKLAASFDGLTMLEDVCFEHKTLNASIRDAIANGEQLPIWLRIQMEHQLAVSGAEKCLFMASRWDRDDQLIEEVHAWYVPDAALRQRIIDGWAQFEKDVEAYQPTEVKPEPVAQAQENLPAVFAQVSGQLSVESNLDRFGEALRAFIARIPAKPTTDQEFADTEAACKRLKEVEERLESAENQALSSLTDVNQMRQTVADLCALARQTRLANEKVVKARKEQLRAEKIHAARVAFTEHVNGLQREIADVQFQSPMPDFAGAIKGLKTLTSIDERLNTTLANAKIDADRQASDLRKKLSWFAENADEHRALFRDLQALVAKPVDDFKLAVTSRIEAYRREEAARLEAQREKIRQEEIARIEAQQREQLRIDAQRREEAERAEAAREQLRKEEAARMEREQATKLQASKTRAAAPEQPPVQANVPEPEQPDASPEAEQMSDVDLFISIRKFISVAEEEHYRQFLLAFVNFQKMRAKTNSAPELILR